MHKQTAGPVLDIHFFYFVQYLLVRGHRITIDALKCVRVDPPVDAEVKRLLQVRWQEVAAALNDGRRH